MSKKTVWTFIIIILVVIILCPLLMQVVPYGRSHTNPPVVSEPKWDSPRTRELAQRACFDCHSNKTVWRWYTNIAPFSWLTQSDVDRGRQALNFSEWSQQPAGSRRERGTDPNRMVRSIQEGEMPPAIYLPMHPAAKLTQAEKDELSQGLMTTLSTP
jgi:mono/diheme cytochrome c family protein